MPSFCYDHRRGASPVLKQARNSQRLICARRVFAVAIKEQDKDVSYIHTDTDLPPVAIVDRSPITVRHRIVFGIIALIGAIAWAIIAFARGETVNAVWFVVAAICTYIIAYRFYARLIEMKIVRPRDDHATPSEVLDDGTDYVPTDRSRRSRSPNSALPIPR